MQSNSRILIPYLKRWPLVQPSRTFFSRRLPTPFLRVDNRFCEIDRHFDRMERDLVSGFLNPWKRIFPELSIVRPTTPMSIYESNVPGKYQVNVVVGDGVPPENIKVTLSERVVKIEAKYEHKSEDGTSSLSQEYMRQFTLPDTVDLTQVKSLFTPEGILQIEAPLPPEAENPGMKEIPITFEKNEKK